MTDRGVVPADSPDEASPRGPLIFNLQRFSLHDGPGVRTTIFFKGCPLRCPWCHNPESQAFEAETMVSTDGGSETVGRYYPLDELVAECVKDRLFYDQSGGGVTLSGGEVMVQDLDYVESLAQALKARGISLGIDTCGVAAPSRFARLAPLVDFFLYDLKFIDPAAHKRWTGRDNELVLENLAALSDSGAAIHLRLILLEGLNADPGTIEDTLLWLKTSGIKLASLTLLPYHRFGLGKWANLGRQPQEFSAPSPERLAELAALVGRFYTPVKTG